MIGSVGIPDVVLALVMCAFIVRARPKVRAVAILTVAVSLLWNLTGVYRR